MSLHNQANYSDQQKSEILNQMTELALSESATLISSLSQSEIRFSVDSVGMQYNADLDRVFNQDESDMIAICHRLHGERPGHIAFLLSESMGLVLIKQVLNERDQLAEMSEMDEEAVTEIANIIINNCLRNYVQILHKPVTSMLPTLMHGHYARIVGELNAEPPETGIYTVKVNIQTAKQDFFAYILWFDYLSQLDMQPTEDSITREKG